MRFFKIWEDVNPERVNVFFIKDSNLKTTYGSCYRAELISWTYIYGIPNLRGSEHGERLKENFNLTQKNGNS
ncbi:hypothetical protein CD33_07080 [Ureibacillus sinduriensis BLB-1 = JCM 15800]|uniref:Uncharacterized protein n=1 Tax=Ureibacillus sinduriensis BLB-1 = JCM 15800 TaxID=1384057 RepID=A0A0A3HYJ7_9BACL|nr:hypothetical protein CD33_07080 [Ureibacillus sinduriensis BLB-1 = JCM 15800]